MNTGPGAVLSFNAANGNSEKSALVVQRKMECACRCQTMRYVAELRFSMTYAHVNVRVLVCSHGCHMSIDQQLSARRSGRNAQRMTFTKV